MSHHHRASPLPSCFRRPSTASATATADPNLATCIYNTDVGLFAVSWSRSRFGRSLHLHHHHHDSFSLHIKLFPFFYNKKGSKKLDLITIHKRATVFWDLSGAKYGSGPEPVSGFYVAVVVDGAIVLLIGDSAKQAYSKTGASLQSPSSPLILRREHVYGTKPYSTKAVIGGHERSITIECRLIDDPRLYFTIDGKRVLEIKHLKWKFRGSDSVEIDGTYVQISWDVYNWLFDRSKRNRNEDGYALFMFTVFTQRENSTQNHCKTNNNGGTGSGIDLSLPQFHHQHNSFGLGFEEKKMKKKKKGNLLRRGGRSSSFSSFSSANSSGSCSSSVMEWADNEDDEFENYPYSGFSLLVYAWRT